MQANITSVHLARSCDHVQQALPELIQHRCALALSQGLLADAKDNTTKLAQKMDDFDAAQKRFLGHKCGTRLCCAIQYTFLVRTQSKTDPLVARHCQ